MKNKFSYLFFSFFLFILFMQSANCQTKMYASSGGEMIFSMAKIKDNGQSQRSNIRWAPFLNAQFLINKDYNRKFGVFSGISIKNIGYIYGKYKTDTTDHATYKKKFRSYNIGIPIGFKIGNLDKVFFFAGYEVEFPFLYKEKTFDAGEKLNKTTAWFTKKEEWFQHGFFVGIQTKKGLSIKFRYYLSQFHNQSYVNASGVKLYQGLKSNIFYLSFGTYFSLGGNDSPAPTSPVLPNTEINKDGVRF